MNLSNCRGLSVALVSLALAGCATYPSDIRDPCGGAPDCAFVGAPPLQLSRQVTRFADRAYPFREVLANVAFDDLDGRRWFAPRGILTDGASFPRLFTSVLGNPRLPEYELAAALHDAYCGYGNEAALTYHAEPWREVHRMFYQALRSGGTDELRAKTIYAAVMLAGPRWEKLRGVGDPPGPRPSARGVRAAVAAGIADDELIRRMRVLARVIRQTNPDLDQIDAWVGASRERLRRMTAPGEAEPMMVETNPAPTASPPAVLAPAGGATETPPPSAGAPAGDPAGGGTPGT